MESEGLIDPIKKEMRHLLLLDAEAAFRG